MSAGQCTGAGRELSRSARNVGVDIGVTGPNRLPEKSTRMAGTDG